jgi:restriction system protein
MTILPNIFDDMPNLIGRDKEIALLEEAFSHGRQIICLEGPRAVGKTTLAHFYVENHRKQYPGGVVYSYGYGIKSVIDDIKRSIQFPPQQPALLVVDEADQLPQEDLSELKQLYDSGTSLRILLVSEPNRALISQFPKHVVGRVQRIEIGGLPKSAVSELLKFLDLKVSTDFALAVYDRVGDRPYFLVQALRAAYEGLITPHNLELAIESFSVPGILGPDGQPYSERIEVPESVITTASRINYELLARLKDNPEILRELSPRQFEELIADLLDRQGYKVDLTPSTRDGGLDMYAAKSDQIGRFLFLVECKRYTPPKKVGVEVVRALYGTVQQKNATAGIIATTSFFTNDAIAFQRDVKYQMSLRDYFAIKKWLQLI